MMQVFFPCGKTSSDMPFGFVDIQHLSCTLCQSGVDLRKSFCYVFMYRTLADPKLLCRLPYCGVIVNNIFGYLHSSFLNITFQKNIPCDTCFYIVCRGYFDYARSIASAYPYLQNRIDNFFCTGIPLKHILPIR